MINYLINFFGVNSKLHLLKIFIIFGLAGSLSVVLSEPILQLVSIEKFISKIVRNLEGLGESEIPTPTIGKFIMEGLSTLDKVAYVRFASVYKNFKEAKDFEEFVGNINENKS